MGDGRDDGRADAGEARARRSTRASAMRNAIVCAVLAIGSLGTIAAGLATADVCYGAFWEPTAASTRAAHGLTFRPITQIPMEHPMYADGNQRACLNSTVPVSVTLPQRTDGTTRKYASAGGSACATNPVVTAGQLFYNRADMETLPTQAATTVRSYTGLEKDNAVRIMFVADESAGAHVVVLASSTSDRMVGLTMEAIALKSSSVKIEEPRLLSVAGTIATFCDVSSTSNDECHELDQTGTLGVGRFKWQAKSGKGIVVGHIPDIESTIAMKLSLIDSRSPAMAVEVGSFDTSTNRTSWETIPLANALRGFKIRSASCADHCLSHATCASCASDDACGYCSVEKKCKKIDSTCASGFDVIGECLDTCGAAQTCGACADMSGCGWCHTTGRCTASKADGSGPQDGTCSAFSVGSSSACETCPGAIDSTLLPAHADADPIAAFCHGRGTCDVVSRTCACDDGYGGAGCEKVCPGGANNPCSRRGLCDALTAECFCKPGFGGARCNALATGGQCDCGRPYDHRNADGTYQSVCSCRLDAAGARVCLEGWYGADCTDACPGALSGNVCGGHGTCNNATGGTCQCDPCFSRNLLTGMCEQSTCATCDAEKGVCSCVGGSMQCVCRGAFSGPGCAGPHNCGNHGFCNSLSGGCECAAGYGGEHCDLLIDPTPTCSGQGTWMASLEMCVCNSGYTGTLCDKTCISCAGHGTCNDDGATCTCHTGFDAATNCTTCASGYGPYPECGKLISDGQCTNDSGVAYNGSTSVTMSGYQCQSWSVQTPFAHPFTSLTGNACRDPMNNDTHPWCYVNHDVVSGSYTRGEPRWEYCSVPQCKVTPYTNHSKICGVLGGETVVPFDKDATTGLLNALDQVALTTISSTVTPQCSAINLTSSDVLLHGDFILRLKEASSQASGEGYARRIIERVGLKATSNHVSVEVRNDGTVMIGNVNRTTDLPYSDGNQGVLCVSDWMPVSSGLAGARLLQITVSETTVMNITRVKACSSCEEQLVVVLSVPYSTTASGICATSGSATSVAFASNLETNAFWGAGSAIVASSTCTSATNHAPGTPSTIEKRWCDQCQYLGELYTSCEAQMTNEGFSFTRAAVVEACRMAFVATYGYERTIPSYLTVSSSATATLVDTVYPYRNYKPSMDAFMNSFDGRLRFDVTDVTESLPQYIVGETRTDGVRTRVTGLPRRMSGETDTEDVFPYPRIQDACRSASDVGATAGFRTYTMTYDSATNETLEVTMCGSATGTVVGIYTKDFADATFSSSSQEITFSFDPWISGLATYEARFKYKLASDKEDVLFNVVRTSNNVLGTFQFYPPASSTGYGYVGYEFTVPSAESGSTVNFTLTSAQAHHITLEGVTVYAKNYAQVSLNYPPFGGFKQVACANFQPSSCGSLKFVASRAKKTYYIVVSGQRTVVGAYDMQIKKVRADLTSVYTLSDNAATSLVRPSSGPPGTIPGTLTPYKLAKYGDTLRVVVRASQAIDKPIITLGSYTVPDSLITSSAGGLQFTATVVVDAQMVTSGHISVGVTQASSLTSPSRGFKSVSHPLGGDIALVVLDNTPITINRAWIVNPTYSMGLSSKAPSSCTNVLSQSSARDVNVTSAKYAKAGDFVAIIFEPNGENVATLGGTIGGVSAEKWERATAPVRVTRAVDAYITANSATFVDAAYAKIDDLLLADGIIPFSITFTDAVGNAGTPITSAVNAPSGVTASSSLTDRLRAARLFYDKTPPRPDSWSLSYLSTSQMTDNQGDKPTFYHDFQTIDPNAKEYRLGDTVVITAKWTEYVTRPYGAYLRSSTSSNAHIPLSGITVSGEGAYLNGKAACFRSEFRPRAAESTSVSGGFIGSNYDVSLFHQSWRVQATMVDPCDIVGKGALAWSSRADCQAEVEGNGAYWIPMWAAWCRHGWGTLGYSLLGGVDMAGNMAADLRQVSKSRDNADATKVVSRAASAFDAIIRTPIPLVRKNNVTSWQRPVPRGDWQADPKVIEAYIEPAVVRWNEYRRVVKRGDIVEIQLYTDQPVKGITVAMANGVVLPAAKHPDIASAMQVERPCPVSDMSTWLSARGLLALEAELTNDGTFADDEDWLDWLMQTSFNYRQPVPNVPNYPNAELICTGFWVRVGSQGRLSVRRLCPNGYYLRISSYAAQTPLACSSASDRVYKATGGYNYWVVQFQYQARHQTGLSDRELQIQWRLSTMDDRQLPSASTWMTSSNFFTAADASSDVSHLKSSNTDAVGPAFDPAVSCGRNADTAFDQPGSAPWVVQDTTPPSCAGVVNCSSTTEVSVANSDGVKYPTIQNPTTSPATIEHVALAGDVITLQIKFTEYIAGGLYITLNDVQTVRATSVTQYWATFTFVVSQELADRNDYLSYKVFDLKDIQRENTATGTFQTDVFSNERVRLQGASESTSLDFGTGTCTARSNSAASITRAKHGDQVTINVTLPNPPSGNGAMKIFESKIAGVAVTPTVDDCVGAACHISMSRVVSDTSPDFLDGNVVPWTLTVVAMHSCAHNRASVCSTRFKLTACASESVTVDFTPPSLLTVNLTEPNTGKYAVLHTGSPQVRVYVVTSEKLHYPLKYSLYTYGATCVHNLTNAPVSFTSGDWSSDFEATDLLTTTDSLITATSGSTPLKCTMEIICVTFEGTDLAGHPLTNPTTCRNFSPTAAPDDPGWFMFHNVSTAPTFKSLVGPIGLNCMDSSVNVTACENSLASATLEYGNYIQLEVESGYPIAITDFELGTMKVSSARGASATPYVTENAWRMTCADLVSDDLCVQYSTPDACRAHFCPTCIYAGMCDFSCGYCDSRRGYSTSHKVTLKTTDFGLHATMSSQSMTVHFNVNPAIGSASSISSSLLLSYTAPSVSSSCAGRCGGAATNCECDATCKVRGTCCADAGHCCAVGTPTTGSLNVDGGCLRPNAVTLTTPTHSSWGVNSLGERKKFVNRHSTIYIQLTANKPIDVRRVIIGGVEVAQRDIAIEYAPQNVARQYLSEALTAFANRDDTKFATMRTVYEAYVGSLPPAAFSWDPAELSREFPAIPSTLVATIRIQGSSLVPQPDGDLSWRVVYHERSGAPFFTDNAELTLSGTGPYWLNPPTITSVSYSLLTSGATCDKSAPSVGNLVGNTTVAGLTKVLSGHQLRTVITFSEKVIVRKWTVEGAETNCYGTCANHSLCVLDPHIMPPDEYDEAEYVTTWTSCRRFDSREMRILEPLGCGVREFIRAVDRAGSLVMGERWITDYCFDLPTPNTTATELIKVRGITTCARSLTNKRFGPGCTAYIYIEADGEIMRPVVQYYNGSAYLDFPTPDCELAPTVPNSPSSAVWVLRCQGSAAVQLPYGTLQLGVSSVRNTAGASLPGTLYSTSDGYKGPDVVPIDVDNIAPFPNAAVPSNCTLYIGSQSTLTVTFNESSWRPTITAFGSPVTGVSSSSGSQTGFDTTWSAPITVPATWLGGSIMPFTITDGEDDVGNVNVNVYGNMHEPYQVQLASGSGTSGQSLNTNCTVDMEDTAVVKATCANAAPYVVTRNTNVTVDFDTNVDVTIPGNCVKIAGVSAVVVSRGDYKSWRATADIGTACDGEVSLSICPLTATGSNVVGKTSVTKFFGADARACLIDNTPPKLQLIDFTSDNPYDSKLATVGDTVTLYFEASEMITQPVITIDGAAPTPTAVDITGPARRRFPSSHIVDSTTSTAYAIAWQVTFQVNSSTTVGPIQWNASGFFDRAGNSGSRANCSDWNPDTCATVYASTTATQRFIQPQIDFTGEVVQTFTNLLRFRPDSTLINPPGNFKTLFSCEADVSSTTISALKLTTLQADLLRHDLIAGSIYQHHLMSAQDFWWQRGGVCGAANMMMCRSTCGECNAADVVVYRGLTNLTVANVTTNGTAVEGDECPVLSQVGYSTGEVCMCNPTLGDGTKAVFLLSTTSRELVSKPTVRFTDSNGTVFTVPARNVVPVNPVTWPVLPTVAAPNCLSTPRVRDGVCDSATNNYDGCWDGGDCCLDTCRDVFSDPALCQTQDCRDHKISSVTGRPSAGFWTDYNAKAAVSRQLSREWRVSFDIDSTLPLLDGPITGTACCMEDKSGNDVLHATKGTFVAGAPCLNATLARHKKCLRQATLTADNGEFVVKTNEPVTLRLEFDAEPRGVPNCTVAGELVTMVNASTSSSYVWYANSTMQATYAAIAQRIAASEEQKRRHNLLPEVFALDLWPNCTRGVTIPFECSIVDCVGRNLTITDADDPTSDVCFDYAKPDATHIEQNSTNTCDSRYARLGDRVNLQVVMDSNVTNPNASSTMAGEACTVVNETGNAFSCYFDVSSTTPQGEVAFSLDGIRSSEPAYLDAVNASYIELKSTSSTGAVFLGGRRVIVDTIPPIFDSVRMYSLDVDNKTCYSRCVARVDVSSVEDLRSCNVTIGGLTANVTGSGASRIAQVYINETMGVAEGAVNFTVTCEDLACNSNTTTTLVGDTVPLIYYLSRVNPLEVLFYSDRPGHLELGNEFDCLVLEVTFLNPVTMNSISMGNITNQPLSYWSLTTTGNATVVEGNRYTYFRAQHCINNETSLWGTRDWPIVPWNFVFNNGVQDITWNTTFTSDPTFPLTVRLDFEPPVAEYVYAYTSGVNDPSAGLGDGLYLEIIANERVVMPTITFGDVTLTPSLIQQTSDVRWIAGPYFVRNTTVDSNKLVDINDCFIFSVRLRDGVDHNSVLTYTEQVNAAGSSACPTQRVDIHQHPPTIVWLQTEYITSTKVDFTFAVDEYCNLSYVILPRGSVEPTPQEVRAGTGASGAGVVTSGVVEYLGSSTRSPGYGAGGKGQDVLNITGLIQGTYYDAWFVPFDKFGNYEPEAQSRWIRTVGLDMLVNALTVKEGEYTDVIQVKLTQRPEADVTVIISEVSGARNVELVDQAVSSTAYGPSVTLVFTSLTWDTDQEVGVRAVDDAYVEGLHQESLRFQITSSDVRYDSISDIQRAVIIEDNDECGVVAYDPANRPLERTLSCSASQVIALLNYSIAEDTTAYVDVYLKAAVRGDDVRVTLTSSDLTVIEQPASTTLVFNVTNYDLAQRVPIIPVNSCIASNTRYIPITVTVNSATSCNALEVPDIPVYIKDLQKVGVAYTKERIVGPPGVYQFDMYLTSQPTSDVQITLNPSTPPSNGPSGSAIIDCGSKGSVWTFVQSDCSVPVTCVVTLIGDDSKCGDLTLDIIAEVTSSDAAYHGISSTPPTITILENGNAVGWYIRDANNAFALPNPWPVKEEVETAIYTITPITPPCKSVTLRPFIPDTEYDRYAVIKPPTFTFAAGTTTPATFRVSFPRNFEVPPTPDVVQIWHDVVYGTDDADYLALSPNLGGSALPIQIIEYDTAGLLLGNGQKGTVLLKEPCDNALTTQISSLGFTLQSAPMSSVVVSISEMDYDYYNSTGDPAEVDVDPFDFEDGIPFLGDLTKPHLRLGTSSLTFTANNWNVPQPILLSAIKRDELNKGRTAYVCGEVTSSDPVYDSLNKTCFPVHICDCSPGGGCGTISFPPHDNCTFPDPEVVDAGNISFPTTFKLISSCWNVTANCSGNLLPSSTNTNLTFAGFDPVLVNFTILPGSEVFTDLTRVNLLRYSFDRVWDVTAGGRTATKNLTAVPQGVQGEIDELGTYCLGVTTSSYTVDNFADAGLYVEKAPALSVFGDTFQITPTGNSTFATDIYTIELVVLAGASALTDNYGLNCSDGGNWTDPGDGCTRSPGCNVGGNVQAYFNNQSQTATFTNIKYLPPLRCPFPPPPPAAPSGRRRLLDIEEYNAATRRRRLLQAVTPTATTEEFMSALNNMTFTDISLDPTGATRMIQTRVTDQYGEIVEGPVLRIDTEGVNDAPIIDIDRPIVYTEKEELTINAPYQSFDVDNANWTKCVATITDINGNFMLGDTLSYNKTKIIEDYQYWNTTIPAGLVDIDATYSNTQHTVTLQGVAPPAAYLRAMKNLVLYNAGPAMSDDDRYIKFCCYDPEPLNFEGCALQRVVFQPVNDAPLSADTRYYLRDPRVDILTDTLPGSDPDTDTITWNISCYPKKGDLTYFNEFTGEFVYTPYPGMIGNDRFVYFTWDGFLGPEPRPLQSKFATAEIRIGNGDNSPVASDFCIEVWENAPVYHDFAASDVDAVDDIIRYQIFQEPELNAAGIILHNPITTGGRRYTANVTFQYAAYSGSDIVQRVRERMVSYGTNFNFNTLAPIDHPGYNVTYFQFVVTDLSGRVSNVANACVWLRLNTETNERPTANPLTFRTQESVTVTGDFDTSDAESPAYLRHSLPSTAAQPTLGVASLVGLAADPYSKAFKYEPFPFYYGTDVFEYLVTDPHGSTSDLTSVTVTIEEVNQPPQGACGAHSTLKYSADPSFDIRQRLSELTVLQGYQIIRAKTQRFVLAPERPLDLFFYKFDPFIRDLTKFDNVTRQEDVFMSCGSTSTWVPASMYHDEIVAVALLAYDVDQPLNDTIRYILTELPTIQRPSLGVNVTELAGTLYRYVQPVNVSGVFRHTAASIAGMTPLAVGDVLGDSVDGPVLVLFKPNDYVHGPITFKWRANDTSVTPPSQGADVPMTIKALCRGGEKIDGDDSELCSLCPAGTFNSAGVADQQTCVRCPAGSYTFVTGATQCVPCPADTYSDYAGAYQCTDCPMNKRSPSGSDDVSDCLCDIGFVVLNSTECLPCALDRVKCTEFGQYMPLPYDGFWQDSGNGARNLTCIPGVACIEKFSADEVRNGKCAVPRFYRAESITGHGPAYVGEGCRWCAPDHYRYAGFCETCDKYPAVRIFFIILGYCVALYVIFELATHNAIPALTILLTFTQITAQMQYFQIPWPRPLARWMQVASLSVADLQILGFECVSSWDYFTRFGVTMFAPFFWLIIIAVAVVFRCWRDIVNQAYLNVKRRRLVERRRKLLAFDVDGAKWSKLAVERDGLPFDRPDLRGKGDDFSVLEKYMYGNGPDESLRRRVFQESLQDALKEDARRQRDAAEKSKIARKLLQTREEIEELQKQRHENARIIHSNITRAVPSLIIVLWWGYTLLARTVVEYFECKSNTESALLVADPQIMCNVGEHASWKAVAILCFILYPIGLFFVATLWLFAHRSNSKTRARVHVLASEASKINSESAKKIEQFQMRYGMMYRALRPNFYLWICVDLGKKLTIVGVKVLFPNQDLLQSFVSMVFFVVFAVLCSRNPYVSASLNIAETLSTMMNVITLIAGFYFQLGIMEDGAEQIATYVLIVGLSLTTLVLCFIVLIEFFPWMKRLMFLVKYHTQQEIYKPEKIGTHESGPQGTSCYLFPSNSSLRYYCWRAVRHPLFDRVIFAVVMMSLACTIGEAVLYSESFISSAYERIVWLDSFVSFVFFTEAAVKIIAEGFILGDGAYLRSTSNCIDFLVIVVQVAVFLVNVTASVAGFRSARFVRYVRLARFRWIRILRKFFQFRAIRGAKFRLLMLEAKAEDAPEMVQTIERCRVVFEPSTAEIIEYRLRVLQPEVLRLARGLIDELYNEQFDPHLVSVYQSQTDPVAQTVQRRYHDIVYDWLALIAEPGQKRAFLAALKNVRDVALDLGPNGVAEEMINQRYDIGEIINSDPFVIPADVKTDTREYKRKVAMENKSFTSTKAAIDKQFTAFQASMTSDDAVEDALNALPLHSVDEDVSLTRARDEQLSVQVRNRRRELDSDEAAALIRTKLLQAGSKAKESDDVAPAELEPKGVRSAGVLARFTSKKK